MTDTVFISYSSKDTQIVKKITQGLKDAGISYWKAPEMIPAGSNYAREIPRAIEKCQVFLLMLSESSQDSIWVEKEIDCAINYRKTIVPLNLTGVEMTEMFRFYLNNVQTILYNENEEGAMMQLLERLQGLVATKTQKEDTRSEQAYNKSFSAATARMELPQGSGRSVVRMGEELISSSKLERHNALKINQAPVSCKRCGGALRPVSRGTYQCVDCGFEDYDSYQKVRNYLNKEGPRSVTEIMRATGVSRSTIEYFLKDERLEIPIGSPILLVCSGCGAGIRTGELCERCKNRNVIIRKRKHDDNQYRFFDRDNRR
ncbi:MAG: TIR domain-containing protein [Lachnospiraceae bacterium]|nr:TIR domain-containing protein [Lachnospiraceae bacterium]